MKAWLKKLAGANRPKVIIVVASSRKDAAAGIAHARTSGETIPVWAWCVEPGDAPARCDRYAGGVGAWRILRELHQVWPALSIVGWTGRDAEPAKLVPFVFPPLRIVVFNEASGFFAATPPAVLGHLRRRSRDALRSAAIRCAEWLRAIPLLFRSVAYRSGERIRDVFLWLWNLLLALAAFAAQAIAPLTFLSMRRRSAGASQAMAMTPAESSEFVHIELAARAFRRRRFLRVLLSAEVPFIVIHRGVVDDAERDRLIDLARTTNSFAVAMQDAYTGWRRQVLSKHPFRVLQPGEVSAVLAPHSSLIVMRKDMLLALGVPRAITNGAALMLIYWKAAAAGQVSLVRGRGLKLSQEPAMRLEDAEFVLRSSALTPNRLAESRGNIAFCPTGEQSSSGRRRVLVVSPYLPFPLSHGGAVRMYNLCRALCGEIDFTLACFREAGEHVNYKELHRVFRSVYVVDIDEKHSDTTVPEQVAAYRNSAMAALIRRLTSEGHVDIVQLEYTQMAEYRECAGGLPVVLVEHDITFTLHEQIARTVQSSEARRQYEQWLAFERTALGNVSVVWTMSEQDREIAILHGAPGSKVAVIPNGVDLDRFRPQDREPGPLTVLFVGSFRHLPNLLAFELLREKIMPAVWRQLPDARLHVIAGPQHEKAARLANRTSLLAPHAQITMRGFVEDVRAAYRDCDAVAVPLPISAGTNIKVMEAMACGRAVVSTTVGCQGLGLRDAGDVLIRDEPLEFARGLVQVLSDADVRNGIGLRARQTVEQRYGWEAIAAAAVASYV